MLSDSLGKDYIWSGNVRELEQAVRRILLTRSYQCPPESAAKDLGEELARGIERGSLDADGLLSGYCNLLYQKHGTFEEVSRRAKLDRRTVKKYLLSRKT